MSTNQTNNENRDRNNGDAVTTGTFLTTETNPAQTLLAKTEAEDKLNDSQGSEIRERLNTGFNPFSTKSAYSEKRSISLKWFGNMKAYSLRRGSIGLASAILGTGILALPQGIAVYGWGAALIMLVASAVCQIYSFYLMAHTQSLVPKSDSYTEMVGKVMGGVSSFQTIITAL